MRLIIGVDVGLFVGMFVRWLWSEISWLIQNHSNQYDSVITADQRQHIITNQWLGSMTRLYCYIWELMYFIFQHLKRDSVERVDYFVDPLSQNL